MEDVITVTVQSARNHSTVDIGQMESSRDYSEYVENGDDYLLISSCTGFSRKLLKNIDAQIFIGVVSFEAAADIYNNTVEGANLNYERLQEGFFIYKILHYLHHFNSWPRDNHGRINIEQISEDVYPTIREIIDSKWMKHICKEEGCKNNMKLE